MRTLTEHRVATAMQNAAEAQFDFDIFEGMNLRPHIEKIGGAVRVMADLCGVSPREIAGLTFWSAVGDELEAQGVDAWCEPENDSVVWVRLWN